MIPLESHTQFTKSQEFSNLSEFQFSNARFLKPR